VGGITVIQFSAPASVAAGVLSCFVSDLADFHRIAQPGRRLAGCACAVGSYSRAPLGSVIWASSSRRGPGAYM
jgi:hypothetical protein